MKFKKIKNCRCCDHSELTEYFNFGRMFLSTAFPKKKKNNLKKIPTQLIICPKCKLVQLKHNYELNKLYNRDYGYKSGINDSMREHLKSVTTEAKKFVKIDKKDIVVDIASNDATLLKNYNNNVLKVGIDPVIKKYRSSYKGIKRIENFFSSEIFRKKFKKKKAKIITSIAVFYDVPNPYKFVSDISKILDNDGIWILEQSYFPFLVKNNAYDSICHEHLTYFTLKQINFLLAKHNLEVFNASSNSMNGGSIRIFIKFKKNKKIKIMKHHLKFFYNLENKFYKNFYKILKKFKVEIKKNKKQLVDFIKKKISMRKKIHLYGASTKGNIILQYCKINNDQIEFAADRNPSKVNCYTPGSNIKVISEKISRSLNPDYYLVMPWHFKKEIIKREKKYMKKGGKLIFPLPKLKII